MQYSIYTILQKMINNAIILYMDYAVNKDNNSN